MGSSDSSDVDSEATTDSSTDGSLSDETGSTDSTDSTEEEEKPFVVLGIKSTEGNVDDSVPEKYKKLWQNWSKQRGLLKIKPKMQFAYNTKGEGNKKYDQDLIEKTSVNYLNEDNITQPVTQIVPIQNVKTTPHLTGFSFFDSSDGNYGIEKATTEHMTVEFEVMFSELMLYYYNYKNYAKTYGGSQWMGLQKLSAVTDSTLVNIDKREEANAFVKVRESFLQEYSGWACTFTSSNFGSFDGVITELSYDIEEGETDAKYSVKIEEVVVPTDTTTSSETGKSNAIYGYSASYFAKNGVNNNTAHNLKVDSGYSNSGNSSAITQTSNSSASINQSEASN